MHKRSVDSSGEGTMTATSSTTIRVSRPSSGGRHKPFTWPGSMAPRVTLLRTMLRTQSIRGRHRRTVNSVIVSLLK